MNFFILLPTLYLLNLLNLLNINLFIPNILPSINSKQIELFTYTNITISGQKLNLGRLQFRAIRFPNRFRML